MSEQRAVFTRIVNDPKDYAWGRIDGVAEVLGASRTGRPEAELWLGAHPSSPSRSASHADWRDLAEWTAAGGRLPFLLKILCAAAPLSIQAHPTPEQARSGFAREEALGVPRDAFERNYKDPYAKPELIVALADGFEALCGFRPVSETLAALDDFEAAGVPGALLDGLRRRLAEGVRAAFGWVLSGDADVSPLVSQLSRVASGNPRFELVDRLGAAYPGDPGIVVALMMNHLVLREGEAIWMPAGNVHAYLRGDGVELMGPSDNVLRGGLTPKHVDTAELERVLDFSTGPAPRLEPHEVAPGVRSYRPSSVASGAGVPFELLVVTADAELELPGPSIAVATDGAFELRSETERQPADRGTAVFVDRAVRLRVTGEGRLFVATAS